MAAICQQQWQICGISNITSSSNDIQTLLQALQNNNGNKLTGQVKDELNLIIETLKNVLINKLQLVEDNVTKKIVDINVTLDCIKTQLGTTKSSHSDRDLARKNNSDIENVCIIEGSDFNPPMNNLHVHRSTNQMTLTIKWATRARRTLHTRVPALFAAARKLVAHTEVNSNVWGDRRVVNTTEHAA